MMAALRHPNVVGFLGVCTTPPCVATEYCGRGSLTDVLRGGRASPAKAKQLDWARRYRELGFRMMAYGADSMMLRQTLAAGLANLPR